MSKFCKTDKFLIYSCFSSKMPADMGGSTISGDLIVGSANTKEEAEQVIEVLKERKRDFNEKFPSLNKHRESHFVFIENQPEWWMRS
jgi:hypothetical protein